MRAIGVLASLLVMVSVTVTSAKAEYQFTTLSFPGHMKIIVEANMRPATKVDYLFVVDNSGSMSSHQNNLAQSIEALIEVLTHSKVDYNAAVISTDPKNDTNGSPGQFRGLPRVISSRTPDGIGALRRNLLLGTSGSGMEEVFRPLQLALSEPLLSGSNSGFLRDDALLNVVVLTDAEDQGTLLAADIHSYLMGLKQGDPSRVVVDAFVVPSGSDRTKCSRDQSGVEPVKIEELVRLSAGQVFSICESNMKSALEKIGGRAVPTAGKWVDRIPMMVVPKVETIEVAYGDQIVQPGDIKRGWTYDYLANEILLGDEIEWALQPAGTPLVVTFVPLEWAQ